MPRRHLLAALLLFALPPLAACTGVPPTLTYAGPQLPLSGACDPASRATLTRRGTGLVLAPNDGTLTLTGTLTGTAATAAATLPGLDHRPYTLAFSGTLDDRAATGILTTPRCRYRLTLSRVAD